MYHALVVGLGNPGRRYEKTRHNIGFMVAERFASDHGGGTWRAEHMSLACKIALRGNQVVVARPQTFMNNSGIAVRTLARFYQIPVESILVLSDDLDLPFGRLRLRANGSAGGHNGLRSIIAELGSQSFARLRIGSGRPEQGEPMDWVLSRFTPDEDPVVPVVLEAAALVTALAVTDGVLAAMNAVNGVTDIRDVGSAAVSVAPKPADG
jgi:PTH1 family peptidyl-tRNA hydrolase